MKTYRVAILGCRDRGGHAARAYHAHARTEVVGLCDLVEERLNGLGDELGVDARYTDLDAMIEEVRPDVVAIPTGTEFHFPLCMRVLEHGVDIDVEKPVTIDLQQADTLAARAKEAGARIAVHHQQRVSPTLRAAQAALDQGRIGRLRYIYASGKGYYGGYGVMNIAVHTLNFVTKLAGPCRSVAATAVTGGRSITPEDVVPLAERHGHHRRGEHHGGAGVRRQRHRFAAAAPVPRGGHLGLRHGDIRHGGEAALVERGGLDSCRTRTSGPTASTTGGSRSRRRSRTGTTPTA